MQPYYYKVKTFVHMVKQLDVAEQVVIKEHEKKQTS